MVKTRTWPVRAMYILIAAALAISLIIVAAPPLRVSAAEVDAEWERVDTPTFDGFLVAPESVIHDYALAEGGNVAYAVVSAFYDDPDEDDSSWWDSYGDRLLKSTDGAATWDDLTSKLEKVDDGPTIQAIIQVATDWVDPDFVAVALREDDELRVYISIDGGTEFKDAGEVEDSNVYLEGVSDLAVSYPDNDDDRDIAIGGIERDDDAAGAHSAGLFRRTVTATGGFDTDWEDATLYAGWDDDDDPEDLIAAPFRSEFVADIIFSTDWEDDHTVLVTTIDDYDDSDIFGGINDGDVYLQCGTWGTGPGWNDFSTLRFQALPVLEGYYLPMFLADWDGRAIAGIALPDNYSSTTANTRILWVWVNYYETDATCRSTIVKVDNDEYFSLETLGQIKQGKVWLTNISYYGSISSGQAIAGVLGTGSYKPGEEDPWYLITECCEGVQVYRKSPITNMEICCETWKKACKPPTGRAAMAVSYVDEDKAYAVALFGDPRGDPPDYYYDESAWSVTFDDGDVWNQLSLVDTQIDYFSDVAVSPDCNKTILVSVNEDSGCFCDSVWLYADEIHEYGYDEYSGHWLRTWCGSLEGEDDDGWEHGILRLAPEELEGADVRTVYLADLGTGNVYWNNLDTLGCWTPASTGEIDEMADLALKDADTLFALDYNGYVAMFDDGSWYEAVDSEEVDSGWTIAVWDEYILVGGQNGDVCYAQYVEGDDWDDVTFTGLEDVADSGYVTVAFDTYFDDNDVIYAALAGADDDEDNGIYQWVMGESDEWQDLSAEPFESQLGFNVAFGETAEDDPIEVHFTGLVVDRPGNDYTDPNNGGVIYASYVGCHTYVDATNATITECFTGAARSLERAVTVCTTCLDWDFLYEGLTMDVEGFWGYPDALKICGCLSPDTNSKIFAIDFENYYDIEEMEPGSLWTFEDCYAKKAPDTTTPDVEADPCSCYSAPFTLVWDPLCDACVYEIQFALDEEFTMPVKVNGEGEPETDYIISGLTGDNPSYSVMGGEAGGLSCETTYHWRVRASEAATGQVIHSWWTVGESFTVPPSNQFGYSDLTLLAPEMDATKVNVVDVGFSWDISATADEFSWVLRQGTTEVSSEDELTEPYYEYAGPLDEGTTYNWQVTAYNNGDLISVSPVGTFTTAEIITFCCDDCDVCFDTEAELLNHFNTAHARVTPTWVWVIIGIGAALVIVVIVLIFRTRRV